MSSKDSTVIPVEDKVSRRDFVKLSAAALAAAAAAGCATNPVTGERQFMLMSEQMEVQTDEQWAPHQFSADYGAVQDPGLNGYLATLGRDMAARTHRPNMPYNFRVVNSVVVNGYTFPAGSVGLARGLMLAMHDESELAAVVGHELGHVNARHAAERMTKNMLTTAVVAGVGMYLEHRENDYAALAAGLGAIGGYALLARYSRGDERQADALGMEYAVRAKLNPAGMVALMDTFRGLKKRRPNTVEILFATHPMSDERYETALGRTRSEYAHAADYPTNRERFMDNTARLRKLRPAIEELQNGEEQMLQKRYPGAETHFKKALAAAPGDYAGLLMMSKCLVAQKRHGEAQRYADQAKAVYPREAQARHVSGMVSMQAGHFSRAVSEFDAYERQLPGNPNTIFYKGFCMEQTGNKQGAAREFLRYRRAAPSGQFANHVNTRLVGWKVIPPAQ